MNIENIIFTFCLAGLFLTGFWMGKERIDLDIIKIVDAQEDLNNDGKINCKDIQMEVFSCFKGKNYYVQNCRTENSTNAHAWVKVWINYIPFEGEYKDTCKECKTDIYGRCMD